MDMLNPSKLVSAFNAAVGVSERSSTIVQSEEFKSFRSTYALKKIAVDLHEYEWRYYEGGKKDSPLLLCLPGASGTAECLFKQLSGLCPKGYHVISAQPPPYFSINEFVVGLDAFLDAVSASENGLMTPMYQFMPALMLKNMILSSFTDVPSTQAVSESIDFVIEQLETLSQAELSSRMTLNSTPLDCSGIKIREDQITIIDSLDKTARPIALKEELYKKYQGARQAHVRIGGDFPFLSASEEVNLYIEVHLRRMGVMVNMPKLEESTHAHAQEKGSFETQFSDMGSGGSRTKGVTPSGDNVRSVNGDGLGDDGAKARKAKVKSVPLFQDDVI